jgi:hypothetical protein
MTFHEVTISTTILSAICYLIYYTECFKGRRGRDRMVVGFANTSVTITTDVVNSNIDQRYN